MKASESVVGIILAGGLAKRMGGGDKCLLPLAGKTLLQRTIERAQPQVVKLLLNANGNSLRFARTRLPVLADNFDNNLGPLAGVQAGLTWMKTYASDKEWLLSFASDTPFFPSSLADQLLAEALSSEAKLVVSSSNGQMQPIFSLWHISLLQPMTAQLREEVPRLQDWIHAQNHRKVEFSTEGYDPFFNINTPQDLYAAEPIAALAN